MEENFDFKDISNSILLSVPHNRYIATTYAQQKILDMAGIFPEIRDDTFSAESIHLCVCGKYDPISQVEELEKTLYETKIGLQKAYSCSSLDEMRQKVEEFTGSRYRMMDAPEEVKNAMFFLDKFFDLYDSTAENGIAIRDEYVHIVITSKIMAQKWEMNPIQALLDPDLRDEITLLAFPEREKAEACFEKLFCHCWLLRLFKPISKYICNDAPQGGVGFPSDLRNLPVKQMDKIVEKNVAFAVIEADRLYGRDSSF